MADGQSRPSSLLGTLTAAAATIGAFIAVGQTGSEWIRGIYTADVEAGRAAQQLRIEQLKAQSDLAKDYLAMIFAADTKRPDRIALLGALSTLNDHPLQPWAAIQFTNESEQLKVLDRARQDELDAARNAANDDLRKIELRIQVLLAEYSRAVDDEEKSQVYGRLHELAVQQGALRAARVQLAAVTVTTDTATGVTETSGIALSVDLVQKAMPREQKDTVELYLPAINAALHEFGIGDPRLIAATLATIETEVGGLVPLVEKENRFNSKEAPFDQYEATTSMGRRLGNTETGDGARFKGRGYVLLTGRANYAKMSERLGLDLLLAPDLASGPEIASRILCVYINDSRDNLLEKIEAGDIKGARRLTNGGTHGLERFAAAYERIVSVLNAALPESMASP